MHNPTLRQTVLTVVLLAGSALAPATTYSREFLVVKREIQSYPFIAKPERAALIRSQYKRVKTGMSSEDVQQLLGEPDEVRPVFEPRILNSRLIGYSHWYVIRRLAKSGSVNDKNEALVRVTYDRSDRVTRVDDWGLDDAPRIEQDGILISSPKSLTRRIPAQLRKQMKETTSVRQAIRILGPGYIPSGSGTGGIQWFFDDGVVWDTGLWPSNLDEPFRPRSTKSQGMQIENH